MSSLDNTIFTATPTVDTDIKIQVYRMTIRKAEITWTGLSTTHFPKTDSIAYLEVSDSPEGEFSTVTELHRYSPPYYIDEKFMATYYRSPMVYYRIRCPEANRISLVFSNEALPNYYGSEISHRHAIMLKEGHAGNLMYLFIRKRLGERCPVCWDTLRGMRSRTNCTACLNTGYLIGYCHPIGVYVSLSAEHTAVSQPIDGTSIPGNIQGWTAGYPRISMGDVLVDATTREIWAVSQIALTTHKRVITKQELVMQRYEDDGSIFELLKRIPKNPGGKDIRHGEILF